MMDDLISQSRVIYARSFGDLLNSLDNTLIILHNLDKIETGRSSGYDIDFFELLNGVCRRASLSLLCVSKQVHETWLPEVETIILPSLTKEQLLLELSRRAPPIPAASWPTIVAWMERQPAPSTLLEQPEEWPPV